MALYEPTELRYWAKEKTYAGYTLFAGGGRTYLIDMEGRVVNRWKPGDRPQLLENGHILDTRIEEGGGYRGFQELDWDGNIVWEYCENREDYAPHHDFRRIFNKKLNAYTTMYIANKTISNQDAIALGFDPAKGPYDGSIDTLVEVDMEGNIIWEWRFIDHMVQDVDPTKPNYIENRMTMADYPGRLNLNLPGRTLRRDWLHCNSMDYNLELDQVVINSVQGEFWVIDHGKTFIPGDPAGSIASAAGPNGDFIYRFGDPARYGQGKPPSVLENWNESTTGHKQIGGSHSIQWIKPGLPGAGHFLIFNNGQNLFEKTPQSYIFEINGFLNGKGEDAGKYVNPPDAGYYDWEPPLPRNTHKRVKDASKQIIWIYGAKRNTAFFSHIASGCQRLPNGNTLICSSTEGQIFEVTHDGEPVWEYICPVTRDGNIQEVKGDDYPLSHYVWRAYRFGPDHPALEGKNLSPKNTITGK